MGQGKRKKSAVSLGGMIMSTKGGRGRIRGMEVVEEEVGSRGCK